MRKDKMPKHVAIIMDGNGRWAKKRLLPRSSGHIAGVQSVKKAIQFAVRSNIEVLTLFALSAENYTRRPSDELSHLMSLFVKQLRQHASELHEKGIRVSFIGSHEVLPKEVQRSMSMIQELTSKNPGLHLVLAINYSGQWDLVQASREIAQAVLEHQLTIDQIDEASLSSRVALHNLPPLDLLIRTSGELRLSNFLLWQSAYSELYFTETLWPDFDEANFESAVISFQKRLRKYGKTEEQVGDKCA
tara:strand:- start:5953 stop:6690 length:738 start_codon:yes stop_codon:yes gene_type:complete